MRNRNENFTHLAVRRVLVYNKGDVFSLKMRNDSYTNTKGHYVRLYGRTFYLDKLIKL